MLKMLRIVLVLTSLSMLLGQPMTTVQASPRMAAPSAPVMLTDFDSNYCSGSVRNCFSNFVPLDNSLFFAVDDGVHGNELWKSDGTQIGTVLVKDINPGGDSFPVHLTVVNGLVFFAANDGVHGQELWRSDGTEAGTFMVKDINPTGSSNLSSLTNVNGELYFEAYDGTSWGLWKSDSTENGTIRVKDFDSIVPVSFTLMYVNGITFYIDNSGLWRIDDAVTTLIKQIIVSHFYELGNELFFDADDGVHGDELWKSDGTTAGTLMVKDINPGSASAFVQQLPPLCTTFCGYVFHPSFVNNILYFVASNQNYGWELWRSDGTQNGTYLVKDISVGLDSTIFQDFTVFNNSLYFNAKGSWWRSDGTQNGTNPLNIATYVDWPVDASGVLFFLGSSGNGHTALWKSDGTVNGTVMVKDLNVNAQYWYPWWININGVVYYLVEGDLTQPQELWRSDGTTAGTVMVSEFIPWSDYWAIYFPSRDNGSTFYFEANDGVHGDQLWAISNAGAPFVDAPAGYWAYRYIQSIYDAGITGGCATTPLQYCPESDVSRAEMAVFLERGIHGSTFTPPSVPATFADTGGNWAKDWIEALKADGITSGCGDGNYCPDAPVTRAEMALFLLKAKYGASYIPPAPTVSTFADVPTYYWAAAWIEQLATEGITSGCSAGLYCPEAPVTRAQLAAFLQRTFNLPLP